MVRIVILSTTQFGYHSDTYYYCKYLKGRCQMTYIGWNMGFRPIVMEGVNVIYVNRRGGPIRVIRLLTAFWNHTKHKDIIIFVRYFKFLSWLFRLMRPGNPMVLDIRTGSVKKNELARKYFDTVLKIETLFFNNITIISNGLIKKLNIKKEVQVLPLGAEVISPTEKIFRSCRMLYVGTLYNRNLENVIYGLAEYLSQSEAHKKIALTIVGDGLPGQLDQLIAEAKRCGISEVVEFTGKVSHDQLKPFFDGHNVGVSYIPLTSYFDSQPPTKTYEYLMSGMPVIATKTNANQLIINDDNGVLIGDSPYEVCLGIKSMLQKMNRFSSKKIRLSSQDYEWSKIVDNLYIYLCRLK